MLLFSDNLRCSGVIQIGLVGVLSMECYRWCSSTLTSIQRIRLFFFFTLSSFNVLTTQFCELPYMGLVFVYICSKYQPLAFSNLIVVTIKCLFLSCLLENFKYKQFKTSSISFKLFWLTCFICFHSYFSYC